MRDLLNKPERRHSFILPSMLILTVFTIIPVISAVGISLFDMNMFFKDTAFVGFKTTLFRRSPGVERLWHMFRPC